jgi:hypothetical protein
MDNSFKALIDRCDDSLREAFERAAGDCAARKHYEFEIEHLFLALVRDPQSRFARICQEQGPNISRLTLYLEEQLKNRRAGNPGLPRVHPLLLKLLTEAGEMAECITSGHLYTGLMSGKYPTLVEVLRKDSGAPTHREQPAIQPQSPAVPPHPPSGVFDRRVHTWLNIYAISALAYIFYGLFTGAGLIRLYLKALSASGIAGWISPHSKLGLLVVLVVPMLAFGAPVFLTGLAARRFAPPLARAIDSWGVSSRPQRSEVQPWRSIFKACGVVLLFFVLLAPLVFWYNQSPQARKIHDIDTRNSQAVLPVEARYVRLTGFIAQRFWIVYHSDSSHSESIAPVVSEGWTPADSVRYFVVANGEEPSSFRGRGRTRFSGEPAGAGEITEPYRSAMEGYRSKGLHIDPSFVMIRSRDLPDGDYVPVSYNDLIGTVGAGVFFAFVLFGNLVRGRFEEKHRPSRSVVVLRTNPGNGAARSIALQQGNRDRIDELEFPYRPNRRIMALGFLTLLPAMLLLLARLLGGEVSHGLLLSMSVPAMVVLIVITWFRSRGMVVRLTDSELRIGRKVLPVQNLQSIEVNNTGITRIMLVRVGKQEAAINQWLLPSPRAFDQIYQALSSLRR